MYTSYLVFSHAPTLLHVNGCKINCSMDVNTIFFSSALPRHMINTMILQSVVARIAITASKQLKLTLHDTIRPHVACRLPCPVHGSIATCGMSLECPGHVKIGWKGIRARSMFEPILPHKLCDYPIRARQTIKRPSPYTLTNARRVASINAPKYAPILLRNICVSGNMEFFCRINDKPRNALPVKPE